MMKRNIFLISLSFCFLLTSCIPGLAFFIKNSTNEIIELNYVICDDLLYQTNFEKAVLTTLGEEETFQVIFSNSNLSNRGVKGEDYFKTETFLSFFEDITIKYLESDILLNKDDLRQFNIQHTEKISAHFFTLLIGNIGRVGMTEDLEARN